VGSSSSFGRSTFERVQYENLLPLLRLPCDPKTSSYSDISMPLRVVCLGGRVSLVLMCLGDTALYRRVKYGLSCRRDVAAEGALLLRLSGCRDRTTFRLHLVSTLCYRGERYTRSTRLRFILWYYLRLSC
jgi:hypothetical protein